MKICLFKVVSDLTSDEDEEGVKRSDASISTLAKWSVAQSNLKLLLAEKLHYLDQLVRIFCFQRMHHRYSGKYNKEVKPPLVIIIQQFEAMSAPAMQDLILLLSRHPSLPVVFVFGVATSLATLHTSLSQVLLCFKPPSVESSTIPGFHLPPDFPHFWIATCNQLPGQGGREGADQHRPPLQAGLQGVPVPH